jgi:hypothetical protein
VVLPAPPFGEHSDMTGMGLALPKAKRFRKLFSPPIVAEG